MYLVEFGVKGAAELHVLHQVGPLALVGCDDADLIGFGSSLQQPGRDFLYIGCLGPGEKEFNCSQLSMIHQVLRLKSQWLKLEFLFPREKACFLDLLR